jgi:hypothetical protein
LVKEIRNFVSTEARVLLKNLCIKTQGIRLLWEEDRQKTFGPESGNARKVRRDWHRFNEQRSLYMYRKQKFVYLTRRITLNLNF